MDIELSGLNSGSRPPAAQAGAGRIVERRLAARVPSRFKVSCGISPNLGCGHALDISETGLGVLGSTEYPVGTILQVQFSSCIGTPDTDTKLSLKLNAVVRNANGARMGLEFVDVTPTEHVRIQDVLYQVIALARR